MKQLRWILGGILLSTTVVAADDAFTFTGYARSGTLSSAIDGYGVEGYVPPKQMVGRLGNEGDHYWEAGLNKKFTFKNSVWSQFHIMLAQGGQTTNNDWVSDNIAMRQLFVEGGGFSKHPDLVYWTGKRFYNRSDVHITDFYYRDYSGTGAGIQNIAGVIDLAYVLRDGNVVTPLINGNPVDRKTEVHNLHFKMKFAEDKFRLNVVGQLQPNAKEVSNETAVGGFQVDGELAFKPVTLALQYGYGIGASLGNLGGAGYEDGDNAVRFVAHSTIEPEGSIFALQSQAWIQTDFHDVAPNSVTTSVVARPILKFTDAFSLQFEGGWGMYSEENIDALQLFKATVAPTLTFDAGVWARPQLRAFVSYDGWNDQVQPVHTENPGDLVYGVQAEVWF